MTNKTQSTPGVIEKGVPLTPDRRGSGEVYPFRDMEVGDSILLRGKRTSLTTRWSKITGWKFTVRHLPADNGLARVWRVK